jgi:DNA-binding NtrC family response regulator
MTDTKTARKTLIVEDDEALLEAVTRAFREAGEDVVACMSFSDARQALREGTFDALLTDVRLGEFNGLQLAVIARDLHPEIRLIVYSGFNDPVLRTEAERLGATYLVKPIPSTDLLNLVRKSPRS